MATVNLKSLIGKLNETCRNSLEAAAGMCLSQTHYNVEIEHWLHKLADTNDSDFAVILKAYGVNGSRVQADIMKVLDRLKTGNSRSPALSPSIVDLVRNAWIIGSVDYGGTEVRSGHLLCAALQDDSLARTVYAASSEFEKISPEALARDLPTLMAKSSETTAAGETPQTAGAPGGGAPIATKTPALDQFTIDLTARAKKKEIDVVLGRDFEIRQIIDILTRRRQNNPILTGEAGVGKTAVVEGFAHRIVAGDVPEPLKNVSLRSLDLGLLQAGAGIKGEFENRLKQVIQEVKASPVPVILFIDEAHTLIGAGGQAGQGDAANMLKPALARGELRTIAATTWAEYKKYFERDAALARRFQVVKVEEPTEELAIGMMRGLVGALEKHHGVRVIDEAVVDAVRLSHRYISGRQLPDKSVSLLDTACARIAIGHATTPARIEDCQRRVAAYDRTISSLTREQHVGADHAARLTELNEQKSAAEKELAQLQERWEKEAALVKEIRQLRSQLEEQHVDESAQAKTAEAQAKTEPPKPKLTDEERAKLKERLLPLSAELLKLQGENPLVQICVDSQAIAQVVSSWTGIPVGRMMTDEIKTVLSLKERMEQRIIGQSHALEAIAQRIRTARANLTDPRRPIGVFLLVGTSGVGKTETAMTLAELLYGGDQNMTVINMSEFKEEHKVSLLMGSPPGYVGYGEGGVLTEAVRRKPYSVVLLDEMEKAHPGVQDIFYQVFDKGSLRDGEGRDIDFKNTLILMTSNAGTDAIMKLCADPDTRPDHLGLADALRPDLLKVFKPAFLGRVTVVPYFPLTDDVMRTIIELQLGRIAKRVKENYKADFRYTPELVDHIASRCKEVESGARNVDHILTRSLLPELSAQFLAKMADGKSISAATVSVGPTGEFLYTVC